MQNIGVRLRSGMVCLLVAHVVACSNGGGTSGASGGKTGGSGESGGGGAMRNGGAGGDTVTPSSGRGGESGAGGKTGGAMGSVGGGAGGLVATGGASKGGSGADAATDGGAGGVDSGGYIVPSSPEFAPDGIVQVMKKLAGYHMAGGYTSIQNTWWGGAYMSGIMALYRTTKDATYLDFAKSWSAAKRWQPNDTPTTLGQLISTPLWNHPHADCECPLQVYSEIYLLDPKPANSA